MKKAKFVDAQFTLGENVFICNLDHIIEATIEHILFFEDGHVEYRLTNLVGPVPENRLFGSFMDADTEFRRFKQELTSLKSHSTKKRAR